MKPGLRLLLTYVLPPLLLLGAILALWEVCVRAFQIPKYLLPSPLNVLAAIRENSLQLLTAMGYTLQATLSGFLCSLALGTVVSFVFAQSSIARRCGYPYAVFLQTMPIVAVAPMIIAVCGPNVTSVILVATIISLFPIITNVTTGLLSVDPKLQELFRVYQASRWQVFTRLQMPTAVPYLIIGAKTSSGLALVGALVGEFFAGYGQNRYGLGRMIQVSSDALQTDRVMAALLASAALAIAIFAVVNVLAALFLQRWTNR